MNGWRLGALQSRRQAFLMGQSIPILSEAGQIAVAFAGGRDDNERLIKFEECDAKAKLIAAAPAMAQKLQEVLGAWPQLDTDAEINGGDAVEWLCGFAEEVRALLKEIGG